MRVDPSPTTPPACCAFPPDARSRLLRWYRKHRRALPWRAGVDPYRVWVSEIMLQQTQVDAAIPYYRRFLLRFPDVQTLASAPLGDVLKAWEGLGYYSRARNLHRAAAAVVRRHGGLLPDTLPVLRALPGIGAYTAAAIASICFGVREPVVDGNVMRVFARFWRIEEDPRRARARATIAGRLRGAMRRVSPADFNQAVMELGALICRPRSPSCEACPLCRTCAARAAGAVERYPVRRKARAAPRRRAAVGWVVSDGRTLAVRRGDVGLLGGLWMFPSARLDGGNGTGRAALRRAILELTGCRVRVGRLLGTVSHAYSHFTLEAEVYACAAAHGRTPVRSGGDVRWVSQEDMARLPFSIVERKIAALCLKPPAGGRRTPGPPR